MEYLIGLLLAIAVVAFAVLIGLDRERSFYVTTAIVVASYYALFAVMGGSRHTLVIEVLAASVFFVDSGAVAPRDSTLKLVLDTPNAAM